MELIWHTKFWKFFIIIIIISLYFYYCRRLLCKTNWYYRSLFNKININMQVFVKYPTSDTNIYWFSKKIPNQTRTWCKSSHTRKVCWGYMVRFKQWIFINKRWHRSFQRNPSGMNNMHDWFTRTCTYILHVCKLLSSKIVEIKFFWKMLISKELMFFFRKSSKTSYATDGLTERQIVRSTFLSCFIIVMSRFTKISS